MKPNKDTKVIVGLSGGVDSSVTTMLLLEQGYQVEALFMKNWNDDDGTEYCTAREDLMDAMAVASQLGVELHTVNFADQYWDRVFEHFLTEYRAGRTPNPDILCNKEIKFRAFLDYAQNLGADYIATGHYARTKMVEGKACLAKGLDTNKDQSYFLHAVKGTALAKTLFPLGEIEKTTVRELATKKGLATKNKKDSTGICFIGERKFKDFLERYLPAQPGEIRSVDGETLGKHNGLMYHTIGQRQGLGIGGIKGASEAAWYVVDKDLDNNELIVAQGANHPSLFKTTLEADQLTWINERPSVTNFTCHAKIRYRQEDQSCEVFFDAENNDKIVVQFDQPQRAITPGQSLVLYQDDICLGGAIINRGFNSSDNSIDVSEGAQAS